MSYQRLLELESQLRQEVEQLFVLAEQVDGGTLPDGLNVADEVAIREQRLARLAEAKAVLKHAPPSASAANRRSLKRSSVSAMRKPNASTANRLAAHQTHRPQAAGR